MGVPIPFGPKQGLNSEYATTEELHWVLFCTSSGVGVERIRKALIKEYESRPLTEQASADEKNADIMLRDNPNDVVPSQLPLKPAPASGDLTSWKCTKGHTWSDANKITPFYVCPFCISKWLSDSFGLTTRAE